MDNIDDSCLFIVALLLVFAAYPNENELIEKADKILNNQEYNRK